MDDFIAIDRTETGVVVVPEEHVVTTVVEAPVFVTEELESVVSEETDKTTAVVSCGEQGPGGPVGASAEAASYLAAVPLSGHRMVRLNASHLLEYASNDDMTHSASVLGLTLGAASAGGVTTVAWNMEIQEPSWSWVVGDAIYLGLSGALSQSPPVSPALFSLCVGFATATDRMFVSVGTPIILSQE